MDMLYLIQMISITIGAIIPVDHFAKISYEYKILPHRVSSFLQLTKITDHRLHIH
jgi:hypothetical protein